MGKQQNDYICKDDRAADGTAYSKEDSVKIRVVNPNAGDPMVLIHQEDGKDKEITVGEMSKNMARRPQTESLWLL